MKKSGRVSKSCSAPECKFTGPRSCGQLEHIVGIAIEAVEPSPPGLWQFSLRTTPPCRVNDMSRIFVSLETELFALRLRVGYTSRSRGHNASVIGAANPLQSSLPPSKFGYCRPGGAKSRMELLRFAAKRPEGNAEDSRCSRLT
jgi:hypothetical protein